MPKPRRKIEIRYNHWVFKFPLLKNYNGIVLGSYILFKNSKEQVSEQLLRHERIHQEQIERHSALVFYARYLAQYVKNLFKYRSHRLAYENISFEIEARERSKTVV